MSKSKAPVAAPVRSAKPKTAADIAKRDRNIEAAAARLKTLQAKQRMANKIRKDHGYVGANDDDIIARFNEDQKRNESRAWVERVLAVPRHGGTIRRWLKDRVNKSPVFVKELIVEFLKREQNLSIALDVDAELNPKPIVVSVAA